MTYCEICEKGIDKGACHNTFSIHTVIRDDGEKTERVRYYLCGVCSAINESEITKRKIEYEARL